MEPSAVLGEIAGLLAEGGSLPDALDTLVAGLGLRGAAVRTAAGDVLGSSGEVLRTATSPVVEVTVPVRNAAPATLTVTGGRPSLLGPLRAAASILGLALAPFANAALLDAADAERDQLADALHDGAVQSLVVARLAGDVAVRGGDVAAARDAIQAALVELRRAMWHIRPRGSAGLVESLQQLRDQLTAAGRPAPALVLEPGVDLVDSRGSLAYRVVQVAAADGNRVAVRRDGPWVTVDVATQVGGGTLPTPELWAARARALGGDLYASAGRIRLVLPLSMARTAP